MRIKLFGIMLITVLITTTIQADYEWEGEETSITGGFHKRLESHPRNIVLDWSDYLTACIGFAEGVFNPLHDKTELGGITDEENQTSSSYTVFTNDMWYFAWTGTGEWEFTNCLGATYVYLSQYYTVRAPISITLLDINNQTIFSTNLAVFGESSGGTSQINTDNATTLYDAWDGAGITNEPQKKVVHKIELSSEPSPPDGAHNAGGFVTLKLNTALQAGIRADRNHSTTLDVDNDEVPGADWMTGNGIVVCRNTDTNDTHDLVLLSLVRRVAELAMGKAVLSVSESQDGGSIKLRTSKNRNNTPLTTDTNGQHVWELSKESFFNEVPEKLWIDGRQISTDAADIDVTLRYEYPDDTVLCADTCKVTVAEFEFNEWDPVDDQKYGWDDYSMTRISTIDWPFKSIKAGDTDLVLAGITPEAAYWAFSCFSHYTNAVSVSPQTMSASRQIDLTGGSLDDESLSDSAVICATLRDQLARNDRINICDEMRGVVYHERDVKIAVTLIHSTTGQVTLSDGTVTNVTVSYDSSSKNIEKTAMEEKLSDIYRQAVITFDVVTNAPVSVVFDLDNDGKLSSDTPKDDQGNWLLNDEVQLIVDEAKDPRAKLNVFLVANYEKDNVLGTIFTADKSVAFVFDGSTHTLAHELGHCLGLDDISSGDSMNIMWHESLNNDPNWRLRKGDWDTIQKKLKP